MKLYINKNFQAALDSALVEAALKKKALRKTCSGTDMQLGIYVKTLVENAIYTFIYKSFLSNQMM